MLTHKTLTNGDASIAIDVDGTIYAWTVGGLADIEDGPSHLEANADLYRADIRTALAMGRTLEVVTPPTLDEAVAAKTAAIQAEKCRARDGGFDVGGTHFDSDAAARISYGELADLLRDDPAYTTPWRASEGVWVAMDAALYAQVKAAGTAHVKACFAWQGAKDAELAAIKSAVATGTMTDAVAQAAVAAVSTIYTAGEVTA